MLVCLGWGSMQKMQLTFIYHGESTPLSCNALLSNELAVVVSRPEITRESDKDKGSWMSQFQSVTTAVYGTHWFHTTLSSLSHTLDSLSLPVLLTLSVSSTR